MEREYLVPGSTPVRAIRAVWDPDKPNSQLRLETATRIDVNNVDHRAITVLPRELKWLYEQTVGKKVKEPSPPSAPGPEPGKPETNAAGEPVRPDDGVTTQGPPMLVQRQKPGPKPKPKADAVPEAAKNSPAAS
jgi:hypothetical protein